jgi:hypothetical protein
MLRRRSRALTIAVVAAVSVLAGCGASQPFPYGGASAPGVDVPGPAVLAAVKATNSEKSAKVAMRMEMDGLGDQKFEMNADGVMSLDGKSIDITAKVDAADESFEMKMRGVGGAFYMNMSGVPGAPDGWMKLSTKDLGASAGPGLGTAGNPNQLLDYLYGVADTVKEVGHEDVRGVATTHYFAVLDLNRVLDDEAVPPPVRDRLRGEFGGLGIVMPMIPADIWVDDEGLVRKMQMVIDFSEMFGGFVGDDAPTIITTMTVELYDFGTPVHIEPPPPDEVIPFDEAVFGSSLAA